MFVMKILLKMPVILLDRLPLPSLRAYTVFSIVLLSCSVYYAVQVISDPDWKSNSTKSDDNFVLEINETTKTSNKPQPSLAYHITQLITFMIQEPLCIWTLINMAYCCLILLGKFIQKLVFGELRVSEQQHIKDKFWNFVFYKFIFVFGVINVQFMDEVVLWCSWFSVLGFLHLLAQLCKDRFEYLSFSPTTPGWSHIRLLGLLAAILMLSGFMFLICVAVGFFGGLNTFAFMVAECVQLNVQTLHVILRYALHLYDTRGSTKTWEKCGRTAYFAELGFELTSLFIDLVHHLHMLLWGNIFLSMASLVICMQLRYLVHEIQRRLRRHRNYLWILRHMEQSYPMATSEELTNNSDNCAICWEKMESARKLPCNHLFHNCCLQSWLEQDTSCPTCRMVLSIMNPQENEENPIILESESTVETQPNNRRSSNHFFHFDGSRYVSWLPSFSVEVTHTQLLRSDQQPAQTSQLDSMARQVQQLFPHISLSTIVEDLRVTRSVELTIENILEGNVVSPPPMFQRDSEPAPSEIVPSGRSTLSLDWRQLYSDYRNPSSAEENVNLGSRFSKSPMERERILQRRKDKLLINARHRYMEKIRTEIRRNAEATIRNRHNNS